jgi:hypothetical protein
MGAYRTSFQKKLREKINCRGTAEHWLLKDGELAVCRPPGFKETHTLKRVMYAAFKGDVPPDVELRANCGVTVCISPYHQDLLPGRAPTRSLELPDFHLSDLGYEAIQEHERKLMASSVSIELTFRKIEKIKRLCKEHPASVVAKLSGEKIGTVIKVMNGVYNKVAIEHQEKMEEPAKKLEDAIRKDVAPPIVPSLPKLAKPPVRAKLEVVPKAPKDESKEEIEIEDDEDDQEPDDGMTREEREWLKNLDL